MSTDISKDILGLKGQQVNTIKQDEQQIVIHCHRDKRRPAIYPITGKKGAHYLLLKNSDKLNEKQNDKLQTLLKSNSNLNTLYVLKEQLQALWSNDHFEKMSKELENWCQMADQSGMMYLKKFAKSLRNHTLRICNYAKHHLTSARIEAGNIAIGISDNPRSPIYRHQHLQI